MKVTSDILFISEDKMWIKDVLSSAKKERPDLVCTSEEDGIGGRELVNNIIASIERSKTVVFGFSGTEETDYTKFAAYHALHSILETKSLDKSRLLFFKLSEGAIIPPEFRPLNEAIDCKESRQQIFAIADKFGDTPMQENVKNMISDRLKKKGNEELSEEWSVEIKQDNGSDPVDSNKDENMKSMTSNHFKQNGHEKLQEEWSEEIKQDNESDPVDSNKYDFDCLIVSGGVYEWEDEISSILKEHNLKVICRKDLRPAFGENLHDVLIKAASKSKKVVVGFSRESDNFPSYITGVVIDRQCRKDDNFGVLVPVIISEDAVVEDSVKHFNILKAFNDDFSAHLLKTLKERSVNVKVSCCKNPNSAKNKEIERILHEHVKVFQDRCNILREQLTEYFKKKGLTFKGITVGCILLHLSTHCPRAIRRLSDVNVQKDIMKTLADILLTGDLTKVFLQEWSMRIDMEKYDAALIELEPHMCQVPEEVIARGKEAVQLFKKLEQGVTNRKVMICGREDVAKIPLVNALHGKTFNEYEQSTRSIGCNEWQEDTDDIDVCQVPEEVIARGKEAVQLFKELEQGLTNRKVMVCGREDVAKIPLVNALHGKTFNEHKQSTRSIGCNEWQEDTDDIDENVKSIMSNYLKEQENEELPEEWSVEIKLDNESDPVDSNKDDFDCLIVSGDDEWENEVSSVLKKNNLNVICRKDLTPAPGEKMHDALVQAVPKSKKIIIGFKSTGWNGFPRYMAGIVLDRQCRIGDDFGVLVPVMISKDAVVENTVKQFNVLKAFNDDFFVHLLKILKERSVNLKVSCKNPHSAKYKEIKRVLHEHVQEFRDRHNELHKQLTEYFQKKGLTFNGITVGCILLHLSTHYPRAVRCLSDVNVQKDIMKMLADILLTEDLVEEFLQEWLIHIDMEKYDVACVELEPNYSQKPITGESGQTISEMEMNPAVDDAASLYAAREFESGSMDGRILNDSEDACKDELEHETMKGKIKHKRTKEIMRKMSVERSNQDSEDAHEDEPVKSIRQSNQAISEDDYYGLLHDISEWYDRIDSISMLKVLYRDFVTDVHTVLDEANKMRDLLDNLHTSGNLSPTDLSILYDTINITKQFEFKPMNEGLLPFFQNVRNLTVSKFTSHRQNLVKLGMTLNEVDVATLDSQFNTPLKKYEDSWHLIRDLEHRRVISEENMKVFIERLTKLQLFSALEALEGSPIISDVNPQEREVDYSKFSLHRQRLMKLEATLTLQDETAISGMYNNPVNEYDDSWSFILELEKKRNNLRRKYEGIH
ncbi:uncharacterized protein LOC117118164 [Anneissia japonica]|uniref:uncharacterized protein LOC117118164 n=1 Tax=Anneissia japonica TaxID=1529436 RepID=UPI00142585B0|nr:uncharacterized protein LOC117118164 [Anneissia japonica]